MAIIKFGALDKKYLLVLFFPIIQIIITLFNKYYPEKNRNTIFELYSTSLGIGLIYFMPYILKISQKESKNEKFTIKKRILYYSSLIICFLVYSIMKSVCSSMKMNAFQEDKGVVNPLNNGAFANIGFEMILLTIASILIIKSRYFLHHFIAIIAFVIFGNISDIILGYYTTMINYGSLINLIEFLTIFIDTVYYYYIKYLMEILFVPYWIINLLVGIGTFLLATGFLIMALTDSDKEQSKNLLTLGFYAYINNFNVGLFLGKNITIIILYFFSSLLSTLCIYYFNPNYILIGFQTSRFVQFFIDEEVDKYYCIIFFLLQYFFLLVYLEIIELNFWGLNKNTKKNIDLRGIEDFSGDTGRDSTVGLNKFSINDNYLIENPEIIAQNENNELLVELQAKNLENVSPL